MRTSVLPQVRLALFDLADFCQRKAWLEISASRFGSGEYKVAGLGPHQDPFALAQGFPVSPQGSMILKTDFRSS